MSGLQFLDGPMGTELERLGVTLPAPLWSAIGLIEAPEQVRAIHASYAAAGADVHTAATFRTTARAAHGLKPRVDWRELLSSAVALAREAARPDGRVAGSIAPLEDCWSPELTPDDEALANEHGAMARALVEAGCDLLLVETMPTTRELVAATHAALATGRPVWSAITLGPRGDFYDVSGAIEARQRVADAGAEAFLINCTPPDRITRLIEALPDAPGRDLRLGAYGNNLFDGETGWTPERYAEHAARWRAAGATILGGCCGTGPAHLSAMRERLAG